MKSLGAGALLSLATIAAWPAWADELPPVPATTRARFGAGDRLDITAPGELVAHAAPRGADGLRRLVFLVRPSIAHAPAPEAAIPDERSPCDAVQKPEIPLELWQATLPATDGGTSPPIRLRTGLPADATDLAAFDLDADGSEELFLLEPGSLWLLDTAGPRPVLDSELLGMTHAESTGWRLAGDEPIAAIAVPGAVRFYAPGAGPRWHLTGEFPVVASASVNRDRIVVSTPGIEWLGRDHEGDAVWAAYVGQPDPWRLRVLLLRPAAKAEARRVQECWVRLPGPEKPIEIEARLFDGEPLLVVTSHAADKLSLLGEKRLRVFPLAPDRSHRGRDPLLAVDSRMNLWQNATILPRDVDGDERTDLVIGYWKGLVDARVVLDVHRRLPDGSFLPSPTTTAFNVEKGRKESIAFEPLIGTGAGDLVVFDDASMRLYPGRRPELAKKTLVDEKSAVVIPLPGGVHLESSGTLELMIGDGAGLRRIAGPGRTLRRVDFDGDGRDEVVLRGVAGGAWVHVVRFDRP